MKWWFTETGSYRNTESKIWNASHFILYVLCYTFDVEMHKQPSGIRKIALNLMNLYLVAVHIFHASFHQYLFLYIHVYESELCIVHVIDHLAAINTIHFFKCNRADEEWLVTVTYTLYGEGDHLNLLYDYYCIKNQIDLFLHHNSGKWKLSTRNFSLESHPYFSFFKLIKVNNKNEVLMETCFDSFVF